MNCPICLESIVYPYITDCCHKFCIECFENWKTEKIANYSDITCPVCRTVLEKNENMEKNELENDSEEYNEILDDEDDEDEITSQNTNYETDTDYEPNSEYEYEDY